MRKAALAGIVGVVAAIASLGIIWSAPEAHAQSAAKTLNMRVDPSSATGKSGALTSVTVSNPGSDNQVTLRAGTTGTCVIHTANLADALALRDHINNALTIRIWCIDSANRYVIPASATPTQYLMIDGP